MRRSDWLMAQARQRLALGWLQNFELELQRKIGRYRDMEVLINQLKLIIWELINNILEPADRVCAPVSSLATIRIIKYFQSNKLHANEIVKNWRAWGPRIFSGLMDIWAVHWENYISISFYFEWDMIVVTVFLSILNQMEIQLAQNRKENCHHDHIPFEVKSYSRPNNFEYSNELNNYEWAKRTKFLLAVIYGSARRH